MPAATRSYESSPAGEIHVWRVELDDVARPVVAYQSILSEEENSRANRFYSEQGRERFILTRFALRTLLGRYVGIDPDQLRFATNDYGKPYVQNEGADARFNLSHSGSLALIAISQGREISVDVEIVRDDDSFDRIAARYFSLAETLALQATPETQRHASFTQIWTKKEAYIKARGLGMAIPLNSFDVSRNVHTVPVNVTGTSETLPWAVRALPLGAAYRGAVAAPGTDWRFQIETFFLN